MIYDALVVGGGPAGITAAIYLKRAGKNVAILEKLAPGGQLNMIGRVDNYTGFSQIEGVALAEKLYEQAAALEIPFLFEAVNEFKLIGDVKELVCSKNVYKARKVVLALGSFSKPLNIDGEGRLKGRGVSYCATCDGNFFKGKIVGVVGDGDSAIVDAMYLSNLAKKVFLICEELRPKRVSEKLVLSKENVEILRGVKPQEIVGEKAVESLVLTENGERKVIKLDAVFVAIGKMPDTEKLKGQLRLDEGGYIITDERMHTNLAGVYACGDVRNGVLKQVSTAVGDGAIAGSEAAAE